MGENVSLIDGHIDSDIMKDIKGYEGIYAVTNEGKVWSYNKKIFLKPREHTSGKCIYLSDDETTEYCVEGPCPKYKTEAQIKAEAYKEFAERFKKKLSQKYTTSLWKVYCEEIDNLLKELVGEDK